MLNNPSKTLPPQKKWIVLLFRRTLIFKSPQTTNEHRHSLGHPTRPLSPVPVRERSQEADIGRLPYLQCCISRLWEAFGMLNQINAAQLNGLERRMVSHPSNFALFLLPNILQRSHSLARRGPKWRRTPAELDSYDHSWASQQEPLELLPFPEVGSLQALEAVNPCLPTCVIFFPRQMWYWGNNQKDPNSTATAK